MRDSDDEIFLVALTKSGILAGVETILGEMTLANTIPRGLAEKSRRRKKHDV